MAHHSEALWKSMPTFKKQQSHVPIATHEEDATANQWEREWPTLTKFTAPMPVGSDVDVDVVVEEISLDETDEESSVCAKA